MHKSSRASSQRPPAPFSISFHFLPIFKPEGLTSHDVVARVRQVLEGRIKVGHTGTLDPFATGVLLLALGKATKLTEEIHQLHKVYRGEIALGSETDTLDPTGRVIQRCPVPPLQNNQLERITEKFTGPQSQIPPLFSAKRIQGRRSYDLARSHQSVELPPSNITVHHMELSLITDTRLEMTVSCSTGTYVRSLARDVSTALGTCGFLDQLTRTRIGPISSADCLNLDAITFEHIREHSLPIHHILPQWPEIQLPPEALPHLRAGAPFHTQERLPRQFVGVIRQPEVAAAFLCRHDSKHGSLRSTLQLAVTEYRRS